MFEQSRFSEIELHCMTRIGVSLWRRLLGMVGSDWLHADLHRHGFEIADARERYPVGTIVLQITKFKENPEPFTPAIIKTYEVQGSTLREALFEAVANVHG